MNVNRPGGEPRSGLGPPPPNGRPDGGQSGEANHPNTLDQAAKQGAQERPTIPEAERRTAEQAAQIAREAANAAVIAAATVTREPNTALIRVAGAVPYPPEPFPEREAAAEEPVLSERTPQRYEQPPADAVPVNDGGAAAATLDSEVLNSDRDTLDPSTSTDSAAQQAFTSAAPGAQPDRPADAAPAAASIDTDASRAALDTAPGQTPRPLTPPPDVLTAAPDNRAATANPDDSPSQPDTPSHSHLDTVAQKTYAENSARNTEVEALRKKIDAAVARGENEVAGLYEEDRSRLMQRTTHEALIVMARDTQSPEVQKEAQKIANGRGLADAKELEAYALAKLKVLDAEEELLNTKEKGQTLRQRQEIRAKTIDLAARMPLDEKLQEKKEKAEWDLRVDKEYVRLEAINRVLQSAIPEEQKKALVNGLVKETGYKGSPDEFREYIKSRLEGGTPTGKKDKNGNEILDRGLRGKSEDSKKDQDGHKKKDKLPKPTWRGAILQLNAAGKEAAKAKAEIRKIKKQDGPQYKDLPDQTKKDLIDAQNAIIKKAKDQQKQMLKYMGEMVMKRIGVMYIVLNILVYVGGPLLVTWMAGRMLGQQGK